MIDLLLGGSPCQGFSIAGKKLNFDDERSKLFFEYVNALNKLKPKYFIFENVRMPDDVADAIDSELGVKRIFINSKDFTGHIRKRYYWTNISLTKWIPKELRLIDIIDNSIPYDKDLNFLLDRTEYNPSMSSDGIITINPRDKNGKQTWQRGRVYDIQGNCPTICATLFDLNITKDHKKYRKLTINECEKLQGVPKNYTEGVPYLERGKMLGNGWTVDVIAQFLKGIPETYLYTVVSLFDGMSCGQLALERAGKTYNQYYASEIDKYAIAVTQKNYPHTMQLGDVTKIDWEAFLDRLNIIQKVS